VYDTQPVSFGVGDVIHDHLLNNRTICEFAQHFAQRGLLNKALQCQLWHSNSCGTRLNEMTSPTPNETVFREKIKAVLTIIGSEDICILYAFQNQRRHAGLQVAFF
jgi:hypothetical protein